MQYMYPYHNRIKQRISNGEYTHTTYDDNYKFSDGVAPAMILHFYTKPFTRPIRKSKWGVYFEILNG